MEWRHSYREIRASGLQCHHLSDVAGHQQSPGRPSQSVTALVPGHECSLQTGKPLANKPLLSIFLCRRAANRLITITAVTSSWLQEHGS
jgi:hypothetical protein